MNSAQIREALKCKYPNSFTIPSETEIRQEISTLFLASKDKKKGKRTKKHKTDFSLRVGSNMVYWRNELDTIAQKQKTNKPEMIYNNFVTLMKETFKIPDKDMPPRDEVKKNINVIKAKCRKDSMCVV